MQPSPKNWPGSRIATTASLPCSERTVSLTLPFRNVEHRVGDVALLEHVLVLAKFENRFPGSDFGEKSRRVQLVISWLSHRSLLWLDERHLTSSARACNIFVCCSIEAHRLSHDTGHLCQKSGMSDRHGRSLRAGQSFNLGTELLRERLDDARAEPGFWLSKDTVRLPNSIVGDRKLPICSRNFIRNGDLSIFCIFAEC